MESAAGVDMVLISNLRVHLGMTPSLREGRFRRTGKMRSRGQLRTTGQRSPREQRHAGRIQSRPS